MKQDNPPPTSRLPAWTGWPRPRPIDRDREELAMPGAQALVGTLAGIDLSHWQGTVNWSLVANAGYKFAIIKCHQYGFPDDKFYENWTGARNAGILRMPYLFCNYSVSGLTQINETITRLNAASVGEVRCLMLDAENAYGQSVYTVRSRHTEMIQRWKLERFPAGQLPSLKPPKVITYTGYYTNQSLFRMNSDFPATHIETPLHMARYNVSAWPLAEGFTDLKLWQYTSSGSVPGIPANVDLNVFYGNEGDLAKYFV